ncbi:MAG: hypothetical protein Q4D56_04585 [Bacteroides sp.]|nr:hypothetical protein [Bacteroides sp.]
MRDTVYFTLPPNVGNFKSCGTIKSLIPLQDFVNPNCFIFPFVADYTNDIFYRRIKYVNDISLYTKDAIQQKNVKDNYGTMEMSMKSFGYYKNKRWEFQKESRFVLYILPHNPLLEGANPNVGSIMMQCLQQNKPLSFHYYDVYLKDEVLDNIEITLSPSITDAQRIIVQALVDKYVPKAKLFDSSLGNIVRLK